MVDSTLAGAEEDTFYFHSLSLSFSQERVFLFYVSIFSCGRSNTERLYGEGGGICLEGITPSVQLRRKGNGAFCKRMGGRRLFIIHI